MPTSDHKQRLANQLQDAAALCTQALKRYAGPDTPIYATIKDADGDWPALEERLHKAAAELIAVTVAMDHQWRAAYRRDLNNRDLVRELHKDGFRLRMLPPIAQRHPDDRSSDAEHRLGKFELIG